MYGFHLRTNPDDLNNLGDRIGKNSEVFNIGDAVTEASGVLLVASNSARILGFSNCNLTMASDNATVAKVQPEFTPALPGLEFEADFDAAVTQTTAVGFYAVLTGTTGAQQLSQSSLSATVGQFKITKLDPRGEGSTTRVLCTPAFVGFAVASAS